MAQCTQQVSPWLALVLAVSAWAVDSLSFHVYLTELTPLAAHFGTSTTTATWAITATLVARLFGGVWAGAWVDRYGYRRPLALALGWLALCDVALALAPSFSVVLVVRTLFGVGMGATWTVAAALAVGPWPAARRGLATGLFQGGWAMGYFAAGLLTSQLAGQGWRVVFVGSAMPTLLVGGVVLWRLRSAPQLATAPAASSVSWREFVTTQRGPLFQAGLLLALAFIQYYALAALYPAFARAHRLPLASNVAWFSFGMLVGAPLWGWVASRRGVWLAFGLASLVTLAGLPLYLGVPPYGQLALAHWLGVSGWAWGALLVGFAGAGMAGITPVLLAGLFPLALRGRAFGVVYNAAAFVTAAVPPLVAWVGAAHLKQAAAMAVVAAAALSTLFVVAVLASLRRWLAY